MIWEYVGVAELRVVVVDHCSPPFKRLIRRRRKFVRERPPILLRVCQESRELALSTYRPFLRLPAPVWSYMGPRTSSHLQSICKYAGVPDYFGSKLAMEEKLTSYVNYHQNEGGVQFRQVLTHGHGWCLVPIPQWFDPRVDILLLKLRYGTRFQKNLWNPKQSPEFSKLRKIGWVLEIFQIPWRTSPAVQNRTMIFGQHPQHDGDSMDICLWHLPELREINLLMLRYREVFRIEMDDKGLLKAGQWAYSLAPPSDDFKEEMGSSWSGVLWNVTLAKEEGKCLMQAAARWSPYFRLWDQQKVQICRNKRGVNETWFNALGRGSGHFGPTAPAVELVEGGDGMTYFGISFV